MNSASLFIPPPPARAARFRSDALDEVVSVIARSDGEHSRVVHGVGPLGYKRAAVVGRNVGLYWGGAGLAQTIRGAMREPFLHVSIDSVSRYTFGQRRQEVLPGEAMVVAPGCEFTRYGGAGETFALGVSGAALDAEVRARRPEASQAWTIRSDHLRFTEPQSAALGGAIEDLIVALDPACEMQGSGHSEAHLISLLADGLLQQSRIARPKSLSPRRCADLEAWIEAHLHESITLGRLCKVAGVGDRSLQFAFRSRRGISPMRFVTERRLARARRLFLQAEPESGVTTVAIEAGFAHLGRFASLYRAIYGETPSQTLRSRGRTTAV